MNQINFPQKGSWEAIPLILSGGLHGRFERHIGEKMHGI
jgi:hypothetical protein